MMRLCYHHIVTGGTTHGWFAVHRPTVPPDGVPGFHQPDARRVSAAGPALRGRVPSPYGRVADGWEAADRSPVYRLSELPSADARRSALVYSHLSQDLRPPGGARALVRDGPGQSQSVDPRALARAAGRVACPRRCPCPLPARPGPAARRLGG